MHDLIDFVGLKYITFANMFSQFTVENLHRAQKRRKNTIFSHLNFLSQVKLLQLLLIYGRGRGLSSKLHSPRETVLWFHYGPSVFVRLSASAR